MRIAGVATVEDRQEFFRGEGYPSIKASTDKGKVYHDWIENDYGDPIGKGELGDAGKFKAFSEAKDEEFYFFSCDDDLVYSPEYFERIEEWLQRYDNKVVCSLHGSSFKGFPINSYYGDKHGTHCLFPNPKARRTLFPGTGALAFHSSLFTSEERRNFLKNFPVRNMADIWMGLLLQKKEIPAIVIPHDGDLIGYYSELPLENTIWGQSHRDDFVQTAVVNEWARQQGFRFPPLPLAQSPRSSQKGQGDQPPEAAQESPDQSG